jgi:pilus assembly protein Flp/PilA
MKNLILAYLKDEDGQTSTEYILLVAVVAMIVFRFREIAEDRLTGIIEQVFGRASDLVDQM